MTSMTRKRGRPRRVLSDAEWRQLLHSVATGTPASRALRAARISARPFYRFVNANPARMEQWRRCVLESGRQSWPRPLEMQSILNCILHNPGMSARSVAAQHGFAGPAAYRRFLARTRSPDYEHRYLSSKRLQHFQSLDAMTARIDAAPTRATRSSINRETNWLRKLEPRRLWKKQRSVAAIQAAYAASDPVTEIRRRARANQRRNDE